MNVTYAKANCPGQYVTVTKEQVDKFYNSYISWKSWTLFEFDAKHLLDPEFDIGIEGNMQTVLRVYRSYLADSPFGMPFDPDSSIGYVTKEMWEDFMSWRLCKLRDRALDRGRDFDCYENRYHSFMIGRELKITHPILHYGDILSRAGFFYSPLVKEAFCQYCSHCVKSVKDILYLDESHEPDCPYHLLLIKA